jgi:aspartyl-tRNA(Asn)/glutamyl-tRNA(Gln) amidotransferase subunit A
MPVGLQIIGQPFAESTVLRVAHAYEQQTESLPAPMVGGNAE